MRKKTCMRYHCLLSLSYVVQYNTVLYSYVPNSVFDHKYNTISSYPSRCISYSQGTLSDVIILLWSLLCTLSHGIIFLYPVQCTFSYVSYFHVLFHVYFLTRYHVFISQSVYFIRPYLIYISTGLSYHLLYSPYHI